MELLKQVAPNTKRVAIIFNPQHFDDELTYARKGAESLGIDATAHPIKNTGELDAALHAAGANQANSLFVIPSRLTRIVAGQIAQYGLAQRLPPIPPAPALPPTGPFLS